MPVGAGRFNIRFPTDAWIGSDGFDGYGPRNNPIRQKRSFGTRRNRFGKDGPEARAR